MHHITFAESVIVNGDETRKKTPQLLFKTEVIIIITNGVTKTTGT